MHEPRLKLEVSDRSLALSGKETPTGTQWTGCQMVRRAGRCAMGKKKSEPCQGINFGPSTRCQTSYNLNFTHMKRHKIGIIN
jgi:hypothetical protein